VSLKDGGEYLRLYPHVHETDGFFAAVLERNKAGTPPKADAPPSEGADR
jgi:16S rRNA (cytosine967-C5)-methyltransferase